VADGCRGEFEVGHGDVEWNNGNRRVRCESEDGRYRRCRVWTYGEVTIYRQLSQTQCRRGSNWGYDSNGIWVNDGCRADFLVGAGGGGWGEYPGGGGSGGSGIEGRARNECSAEARRRGYANINVTSSNASGGNVDVLMRAERNNRPYNVGCRFNAFNSRASLTSEDPIGGGGGNSAVARGRDACESKARGMGYQSVSVTNAGQRASEVEVEMRARQAGNSWFLRCKYRIPSNSATIYEQSQEGGGGGGGGAALLERARTTCSDKARAMGYQVMDIRDTRAQSEIVKVYFTLRRGASTYPDGECNYIIRDRVATVAPGRSGPQPR
jgi:hypothetical protein